MSKDQENIYPITLFMASVWIWAYSFLIVWFTFETTQAFKLRFSVIPLIIFPFGIAFRDTKKIENMR